jgi:hypothetical protein
MYITLDIIQKRGGCGEYLRFFEKRYPNGVEMLELIEHGHIPYHGLHWGYKWLDPNEEEIAAYRKRVKVSDSEGVDASDHVTNSMLVSHSSKINQSQEVYNSKEVNFSQYVVKSEFVDDSKHIADSCFITNCCDIINCKNAENSNQVVDSTYIINSHGVYDSYNITDSHAIWRSNNLTNCFFCFDCADTNNAMFCLNQHGGEYMLFNKPVDKTRFEMVQKQYKRYALPFITLTDPWNVHNGDVPHVNHDFRDHTKNIPASFWEWVKTIPGYNPEILYSLTFIPQFLV